MFPQRVRFEKSSAGRGVMPAAPENCEKLSYLFSFDFWAAIWLDVKWQFSTSKWTTEVLWWRILTSKWTIVVLAWELNCICLHESLLMFNAQDMRTLKHSDVYVLIGLNLPFLWAEINICGTSALLSATQIITSASSFKSHGRISFSEMDHNVL